MIDPATKGCAELVKCAFQLDAIAARSRRTFFVVIEVTRRRAARPMLLQMDLKLSSTGLDCSSAPTRADGISTAESINAKRPVIDKMPSHHTVHVLRM